MKDTVKRVKKAIKAKEDEIKHTFGIYSISFPRAEHWKYTPPFLAPNDKFALDALKDMVKSHPEIQKKNAYCIAEFDSITGKIKPLNPFRLLKG